MKDFRRLDVKELTTVLLTLVCLSTGQHVASGHGLSAGLDSGLWCAKGEGATLDSASLDYILKWLPEEYTSPDALCEDKLGDGSFLCRYMYNGNYSSICQGLWCRDPSSGDCSRVAASDGVPCGSQQWCLDGECRYSAQAQVTSESCPFGDTRITTTSGTSCRQTVIVDPRQCYDAFTEQMCCSSCQAIRSNRLDCPYGDRLTGCQQNQCFFMRDYDFNCCQTCSIIVETLPPLTDRTTVTSSSTKQSDRTTRQNPGITTSRDRQTTSQGHQTTSLSQQSTGQGQQTTSQTPRQSQKTTSGPQQETPTVPSSIDPNTGSTEGGGGTPGIGATAAQDNTNNDVAIGAGIGVGVAVVVAIVAVVVYVVYKRRVSINYDPGSDEASTGSHNNPALEPKLLDPLGADLSENRTTWYPSYRSTTTMQ